MINEILSTIVLVIIAIFIAVIIKYAIDSFIIDQESNKNQSYQTYEIFNQVELQKRQNLKEVQQEQELISEKLQKDQDQFINNQQKTIFSINNNSTFQSDLNQEYEDQQKITKNSSSEKPNEKKKKEKFLVEEIQIQTTQVNKVQESQINKNNYSLFVQAQQESKLILNPIMPKQDKIQQEEYVNVILALYQVHENQYNKSQAFVSQILNQNQFETEITNKNSVMSSQLKERLCGFRKVKCDPNSFFASISFQVFQICLSQPNQNDFENELIWIQTMNVAIKCKSFSIDEDQFNNHQNYFLQKMLEIYQSKCPLEQLEKLMNDRQSQFYGLSIIYFRNLISQLLKLDNPDDNEGAEEIQYWENNISYDQDILQLIAERLKIQIDLYNVNRLKSQVSIQTYGQQNNRQIHLICSDEHYDIGISKF